MSGATSSHSGLRAEASTKATAPSQAPGCRDGRRDAPTLQALAADYESGQKRASRRTDLPRSMHSPNCFAFCHLNVHVRDGKVVKTSRAPYNEKCYDRICQRDFRMCIESTIRRACSINATRGGNRTRCREWERVELGQKRLDEIARKIKIHQTGFGESAVAFLTASGNQSCAITSAYGRLSSLMNASSIGACLDMGSYYGMQAVAGCASAFDGSADVGRQ